MPQELDFEIFSGDSKNAAIPVHDVNGQPVDLTGSDIVWKFAEWMGAPALLTKTRTAGGSDVQIGLRNGAGSTVPNEMVVKILPGEIVKPEGIYVHHAVVSFPDAQDTVKDGLVIVKDSPS
jgi:hypothetical protein